MDSNILAIIVGAVALIIGIVSGKFIFAKDTSRKVEEAENTANTILKEAELKAENIKKERELEAKEKFVQLKSAHDREINDK
jgi:ribonucrease Y